MALSKKIITEEQLQFRKNGLNNCYYSLDIYDEPLLVDI